MIPSEWYHFEVGPFFFTDSLQTDRISHMRYFPHILLSGKGSDPIIRIDGAHASVSGPGTLLMLNAAPRGVVNIGPTNRSHAGNIVFNTVADITIIGPGPSWCACTARVPLPLVCTFKTEQSSCCRRFSEPTKYRPELNGSSAVCIDSTPYELLCVDGPPRKEPPPPGCRDGATYYNLVRDIMIGGIDIGAPH